MRFLPVGLEVSDRRCVVVGGGAVGTRKVRTLLSAGADVTVVSPKVTPDLARDIDEGRVHWCRETMRGEHLDGAYLVVMATDDPVINAAGVQIATDLHALACDASSSRDSKVIFGAILERDGVTIATFTDGRDPAGARRTRDRIARLLSKDDDISAEHPGAGG